MQKFHDIQLPLDGMPAPDLLTADQTRMERIGGRVLQTKSA